MCKLSNNLMQRNNLLPLCLLLVNYCIKFHLQSALLNNEAVPCKPDNGV